MADEKQSKWFITLDELIKYEPEEVLSLFVSDLRNIFAGIYSASDLLSSKELSKERHEKLIALVKENSSKAYEGLDLMLAYLKARNEPKDNSDNASK